jgi:hypothetical protein
MKRGDYRISDHSLMRLRQRAKKYIPKGRSDNDLKAKIRNCLEKAIIIEGNPNDKRHFLKIKLQRSLCRYHYFIAERTIDEDYKFVLVTFITDDMYRKKYFRKFGD